MLLTATLSLPVFFNGAAANQLALRGNNAIEASVCDRVLSGVPRQMEIKISRRDYKTIEQVQVTGDRWSAGIRQFPIFTAVSASITRASRITIERD